MENTDGGIKEAIRQRVLAAGAIRCGFAAAQPVDASAQQLFHDWVAAGRHGTMAYCERNGNVRDDPRLLLDGAQTVIVGAFGYRQPEEGDCLLPIARYARGKDYHYVLKQRLGEVAASIEADWGGSTRVCVDSAPIRERWWAQQAGVGFIGLNNHLIVDGEGSYMFLAEILWTGRVAPDAPCAGSCEGCGTCVAACPGAALDGRGGCDARRCLSYLTIEHRYGDDEPTADLHGAFYGCDICQQVCPHNAVTPSAPIAEFMPDPAISGLTADELLAMTPSAFRRLTATSAMSRVPLRRLLRNLPPKQ